MGVYGLHVCCTPQLYLTKQLRGAEGNCHYLDMHAGIANARWREKRSDHSRRMRNPELNAFGNRSIAGKRLPRVWRIPNNMTEKLSVKHNDRKFPMRYAHWCATLWYFVSRLSCSSRRIDDTYLPIFFGVVPLIMVKSNIWYHQSPWGNSGFDIGKKMADYKP